MKLFWENGYEGTSFEDLIAHMGISPSSFYNSFGNKEQLYREVTDCFVQQAKNWYRDAFSDDSIDTHTAFSRLLETLAHEFTRNDVPRGCLVSLSGTHQASDLSPLREMMVDHRATSERYFADRIRKGIADGDMPADCDVEDLAAYVNTIVRGLAVQARDGASRERLREICKIAMEAWPKPPPAAVSATRTMSGVGARRRKPN
jgi:AcrR family transcriptional regulator